MPAAFVQPLRVDDAPDRDRHVVRADQVERPFGVAPLDQELGHERHVEHADGFAHHAMLGRLERERVVARPTELDVGVRARRGEPFGVLPAR